MRKLLVALAAVLLFTGQLLAQKTVTGTVTDGQGKPLANVSVQVKGTRSGTVTNENGTYSINVPADGKVLVFTSVGTTPSEVTIGSQTVINSSLQSAEQALSEVVVVAYGTQKKATLTGAVATVKGSELENRPFTSIDKGLQGQVAGLQSVAASGQPGASQSILIRGVSSINASNSPLWVVDGIPVNTSSTGTGGGDVSRLQTTANVLSTMNPNDIESVTVLKDASSTALYGSRGANGVILVTTKKGRAGKTRFRFDTEVGKSDIAYENDKYRPLNAQEYFTIAREGYVNLNPTATDAQINTYLTGLGFGNGIDFNWLDNTTRKGSQQQYNISAEGGNDKTTFYLSGGYFKQEGTTINSKLDRYNIGTRVNHKANDRLSFNFAINGGFVNQRAPLSGGAFGNPVLSSYFLLPSRSAYNADGTYNLNAASLGGLHNTIALAEIDKRFLREGSLRGNLAIEYKILDNLKFRSSGSGDLVILEEDQYNNPLHGDGAATAGRAFSYYTRYWNKIWTNTLDFEQALNKAGDITLLAQAGYEAQSSRGYTSSLQSQAFPSTLALTYPASGATPITASATISDYTFVSQFGSVNLNYKNRYVLSGSYRRDGSSKFSPDNKYGNFWSVGGSWNVEQEAFMADISFINQLKLRASYGQTGNAGIGNYDWAPSYSFGSTYNGSPGSAPSNVGDYNLTWEVNKPLDIGIDVGFLKNRVNLTVDWYKRKSEQLLLSVPLSPTSGFSAATRNIGSMENNGLEVTIDAVPVQSSSFTWNVNFNFSHNTNKVTSLPNGADIVTSPTILRQGVGFGTYYMREYAGVDPANGNALYYVDATKATTTSNYSSAALILQDKQTLPKYFGGLTNTFTYKGISLEAQLYYSFGNYVRDSWGSYYLGAGFGPTYNKVARIFDRWTTPGQVTDIPRYINNGNNSFQSLHTFWLNKADFVRLRNLQIGYTLPKNLVSAAKLSNVMVYVRGTNLITWVKDDTLPFDPEQGTGAATNLNVFIPKTVTVGLNLSF